MAYYVSLFSPETYEAFSRSERNVSGYRPSQRRAARRVRPGDKFICYMTKLSRWVGVLEVIDGPFEDDMPIFQPDNDPFVIRFHVKPLAWLDKEKAIPVHEDRVWHQLSFTRDEEKGSSTWTGKVRRSLNSLPTEDAQFLEQLIIAQASEGEEFPIDEKEYRKLVTHRVRRLDREVTVSVPEDTLKEKAPTVDDTEVRESIQIQALLASIGASTGMRTWIPQARPGASTATAVPLLQQPAHAPQALV